jgi:hypothetical protein
MSKRAACYTSTHLYTHLQRHLISMVLEPEDMLRARLGNHIGGCTRV